MSKSVVMAGWDDVPHLSKEEKDDLYSSIPAYQRDARTKGVPQLGAGAIYPIPESEFVVPPFAIPHYWTRAYGMDVGWNRTAVAWGAHDRETDTLYLYQESYRGAAEPSVHADAVKARGKWIRGAIDPAARGRSQKDGEQLLQLYTDLGLHLQPAFNGVESGIFDVFTRITTGRLKVFSTMSHWLSEFRLYRRDEKGAVVKGRDHLMDASRYLAVELNNVEGLDPFYLQKMGHSAHTVKTEYDPFADPAPEITNAERLDPGVHGEVMSSYQALLNSRR